MILTFIQQKTLKPYLEKISILLIFRLISVGQFSNIIFPSKVGMWIPGLFLKANYHLKYKLFSYGVIFQSFIAILVMLAVSGTTYFLAHQYYLLTVIYLFLIYLSLYLIFKLDTIPSKIGKLRLSANELKLLFNKNTFFSIFIAHIFILIFYFLRIYFALIFMGIDINFITCLNACFVTLIVSSIPFLPGAIGVREVTVASSLIISGFDPGQITTALLIERMAQLSIYTPISIFSYFYDSKIIHRRTITE